MYPLDTVKTRLQALPSDDGGPPLPASSSKRTTSRRARRWQLLDMLIRIIRTEGLSGTFKGFAANMINTFSMRTSGSTPEPHAVCSGAVAVFFAHTVVQLVRSR